jgi:hypothetical protein
MLSTFEMPLAVGELLPEVFELEPHAVITNSAAIAKSLLTLLTTRLLGRSGLSCALYARSMPVL